MHPFPLISSGNLLSTPFHYDRLGRFLLRLLVLFVLHDSVRAQTLLFDHFETSARLGMVTPGGNLVEYAPSFPAGGLMVHSSYYGRFMVHGALHYGRLKGEKFSRKLHYAKVGLGLGYAPTSHWLPECGLGLNSVTVGTVNSPKPKVYLLDAYESEFGYYPFLNWRFDFGTNWRLRFGGEWDLVFSEPKYSSFPLFYVGVGKSWW